MKPIGRPSKFTPEARERILQAVSLGVHWELAPLVGGVSYPTFREWMRRGESEESGEFRDFFDAVKEAEARAAMKLLAIIEKDAQSGHWSAAAWKLERRYPAKFGKLVQRLEHTGPDGERLPEPTHTTNVQINFQRLATQLKGLSDDERPPEACQTPDRSGSIP
ncbi:MAG: hypothetical protein HY716_03815 [Planctomycetes bacterium]|nr:hypothetical protein [Planctomycetota bacterium]